jgi:transcriptional regulator with XRE-family HTH domain
LDTRAEIGQRIARQRRRRGLSQVVVAGLVGRSESWLSQVERGLRSIDSHSVLVRLAEVLDVDVSQLTTNETSGDVAKYEATEAIRDAMLRYETLPVAIGGDEADAKRPRLTWLRHELHRANRLYQATGSRAAVIEPCPRCELPARSSRALPVLVGRMSTCG